MRYVDSHIHLWDPFTTPRSVTPLAKLTRRSPALGAAAYRLLPRGDREFIADPRYVLAPYLPADYAADTGDVDVAAVVHVEASWHGREPYGGVAETSWLAGLPFGQDGVPELGAVVVHADPSHAAIGAVLDAHLAASPLVRGVRCMGARHTDTGVRPWARRAGLFTDPAFLRGFAALAERGLAFDAFVYSHQLPDVAVLAGEYPEVTIVLDHYATPVGVLGPTGRRTGRTERERRDIHARWRDDLAAVAAHGNVVAKQSGTGMPQLGLRPSAPGRRPPLARLTDLVAPLVRHTFDSFGADRVLWGSNYPIDKPVVELPAAVRVLEQVLGADLLDVRDRLFHANAARVYRLANTTQT